MTKARSRAFRREQMQRDKAKSRRQTAPKPAHKSAYQQNKRNTVRAELRTNTDWGWL